MCQHSAFVHTYRFNLVHRLASATALGYSTGPAALGHSTGPAASATPCSIRAQHRPAASATPCSIRAQHCTASTFLARKPGLPLFVPKLPTKRLARKSWHLHACEGGSVGTPPPPPGEAYICPAGTLVPDATFFNEEFGRDERHTTLLIGCSSKGICDAVPPGAVVRKHTTSLNQLPAINTVARMQHSLTSPPRRTAVVPNVTASAPLPLCTIKYLPKLLFLGRKPGVPLDIWDRPLPPPHTVSTRLQPQIQRRGHRHALLFCSLPMLTAPSNEANPSP